MLIRFFDVVLSIAGLILLSPVLLTLVILISIGSKGPVLFRQVRVGKDGRNFRLNKFRTMYVDADKKGLLTVGGKDSRVTSIGYYLRKYKLDELPQLWNVLLGDMSLVGPRPEVAKYVNLYTEEQRKVLSVRPGITDLASIEFRNENELLAIVADPEAYYIAEIMPKKLELNFKYIHNRSLLMYFTIILRTIYASINGK